MTFKAGDRVLAQSEWRDTHSLFPGTVTHVDAVPSGDQWVCIAFDCPDGDEVRYHGGAHAQWFVPDGAVVRHAPAHPRDCDAGRIDTLRLVYIGAACAEVVYRWHESDALTDDGEKHARAVLWVAEDVASATLAALARMGDETAMEMLGGEP